MGTSTGSSLNIVGRNIKLEVHYLKIKFILYLTVLACFLTGDACALGAERVDVGPYMVS